jgi:hypothetical protein
MDCSHAIALFAASSVEPPKDDEGEIAIRIHSTQEERYFFIEIFL